jgi:hypothetical protein
MSFFDELRRGYRAGRAARPADTDNNAKVPPSDLDGDGFGDVAQCRAMIGELLEENASLKAQLAQGQDQRDRVRIRELESILAFPGVRTALVKTLHPDTSSGGSTATRTETFQTLLAVMERLGIRG